MMTLRVLEMLIANLFVTLCAWRLQARIRTGVRHVDACVFVFLWILTAAFLTFAFGVLGILDPHALSAVTVPGALWAGYAGRREIRRWPERLRGGWPEAFARPPGLLAVLLIGLAAAELARILFHAWFLPPYAWDILTYHLPNVAEWVQARRIGPMDAPTLRTHYPMAFEVLETWFAVFLHHDVVVEAAGAMFDLLAACCVYSLARSVRVSPALAALAALTYILAPTVAVRSTACDTDLPIAALFLLCAALSTSMAFAADAEQPGLRPLPAVWAAAFLYGVGVKPTMVMGSVGLILLMGVALAKHRRADIPSGTLDRPARAALLGILAAGLLLGSFWYVRNWIVFQNPFHPIKFSVGRFLVFGDEGTMRLHDSAQQGHFSLGSIALNLRAFFTVMLFDRGALNWSSSYTSGWGWFSFACGWPALLLALAGSRALRLLATAFFLSFVVLMGFVYHDPWYARFVTWFPALFSVSFAWFVGTIRSRAVAGGVLAAGLLATALNYAAALNAGEFTLADFRRAMALPVWERSTARCHQFLVGPAYADALQRVPRGETIVYWVEPNHWVYPLYDADFSRRLVYEAAVTRNTLTLMRRRGWTYLFLDPLVPGAAKLLEEPLRAGSLERLTPSLYRRK